MFKVKKHFKTPTTELLRMNALFAKMPTAELLRMDALFAKMPTAELLRMNALFAKMPTAELLRMDALFAKMPTPSPSMVTLQNAMAKMPTPSPSMVTLQNAMAKMPTPSPSMVTLQNAMAKIRITEPVTDVIRHAHASRNLDTIYKELPDRKFIANIDDLHRTSDVLERLRQDTANNALTYTSQQKYSSDEFSQIDWVKLNIDGSLKKTLQQRMEEIGKTMEAGAPLAVILLCGSTLEGLLLESANKHSQKFNQAKAAPKYKNGEVKKFPEWTLANLIDVAYEVGLIQLHIKEFSHSLRNFRNYIHPRAQLAQKFNPNMDTAEIIWKVLQAAIADLSKIKG